MRLYPERSEYNLFCILYEGNCCKSTEFEIYMLTQRMRINII